jgi:hypothetical protein
MTDDTDHCFMVEVSGAGRLRRLRLHVGAPPVDLRDPARLFLKTATTVSNIMNKAVFWNDIMLESRPQIEFTAMMCLHGHPLNYG